MTEIEKIRYAKDFIDKLANGINPIDNSELSETDIVNNVKISRCLFYVSDILRKVIEGNGISVEKKKRKLPFPASDVLLKEVKASDKPLPVSKFTEYINSFVDTEKYKKRRTRKCFVYRYRRAYELNVGKSRTNYTRHSSSYTHQRYKKIVNTVKRGLYGYFFKLCESVRCRWAILCSCTDSN